MFLIWKASVHMLVPLSYKSGLKMKNVVCDVMPCSLVQIYRCSERNCCLHPRRRIYPEDGGSTFHCKVSIFLHGFFHSKDGASRFQTDIGEFTPDYIRLHFTQQNSSRDQIWNKQLFLVVYKAYKHYATWSSGFIWKGLCAKKLNLPSTWSELLFKKLIFTNWVKKSPSSIECEVSLVYSRQSSTQPYHDPK